MDDIELSQVKSSEKNNDENFEEELSAFYSANVSTAHEIETKLDSDLSDSEDNCAKPLLEQSENKIETVINEEDKDYGPATSDELGTLLNNQDSPDLEFLDNQNEDEKDNLSSTFPKLFIKKKVSIYCLLLGFGMAIYTIPKFFYGVNYDEVKFYKIFF